MNKGKSFTSEELDNLPETEEPTKSRSLSSEELDAMESTPTPPTPEAKPNWMKEDKEWADGTYDKLVQGAKNLPGAMVDLAKSVGGMAVETYNNPLDVANTAARRLGAATQLDKVPAALDAAAQGVGAKLRGGDFSDTYDTAFDDNQIANRRDYIEAAKKTPDTDKAILPLATTAIGLATGGLGAFVGGNALSLGDEYASTGKIDTQQFVADNLLNLGTAGAGKMLGNGLKAGAKSIDKGAKGLAERHQRNLTKNNPEAQKFIDEPSRIKAAEGSEKLLNDSGRVIEDLKAKQPELYNKVASDVDTLQDKAWEKGQKNYKDAELDAVDVPGYKFDPNNNTVAMTLDGIKERIRYENTSPMVKKVLENILETVPDVIEPNGKRIVRTNPITGVETEYFQPHTSQEMFRQAYELDRHIKTRTNEMLQTEPFKKMSLDGIVRKEVNGVRDVFLENMAGDQSPAALKSYGKATGDYARLKNQYEAQSNLGKNLKRTDGSKELKKANADTIRGFDNQTDTTSRANTKGSIAELQDMVGETPRDLFSDIESNKKMVEDGQNYQREVTTNAVDWKDLNRGSGFLTKNISKIPYVGDILSLTPQARVQYINAVKGNNIKLGDFMEKVVKAGKPVNDAMLRSIALQSRESPEEVRELFKRAGLYQ